MRWVSWRSHRRQRTLLACRCGSILVVCIHLLPTNDEHHEWWCHANNALDVQGVVMPVGGADFHESLRMGEIFHALKSLLARQAILRLLGMKGVAPAINSTMKRLITSRVR